ncbi:HEPN family nuclease [Methylobacterium indicum]|uniref:HEPN family nuclease n=1 Tax=Methylobacterium indicum TaxID=1775910 RepID=UPI002435518D|nr:HEPN family nuclease [Methylobacterium indicum]
MAHPEGPLLQALAPRILANLDRIEALAADDATVASFPETQLLVSLLGVLVFPQQRSEQALDEILRGYEPLEAAITILHRSEVPGRKRPEADQGNLAALLRHCIAHFNVLPIERGGDFVGIRVWNVHEGRITFVADLEFTELRRLARHVLERLSSGDPRLGNPIDPMDRLLQQRPEQTSRKPPKISDAVWEPILEACDGDRVRAHRHMDQALRKLATTLRM